MFGKKKKSNLQEDACCAFCEYAEESADEGIMKCSKKGNVASDFICRKFSYDLLKRKPRVLNEIPTIDPEALGL